VSPVIKSVHLRAVIHSNELTTVDLWGNACIYHGLVGSARLVADLRGTQQGITLNLSILVYFSHLSATYF